MKLILISPCFNAAENLSTLIQSVQAQNDHRWHHILIDDISEDDTHKKLLELTASDDRYTVIKNDEKKYALRNIVEAARAYQEDNNIVIGVVDGDDSLCNPDTVRLILSAYETGADVAWTGHRWDVNGANISREMPAHVNPYQWVWCSSHFRTFRAALLKNISDKNFKNTENAWFERGYDQALMLPLLRQTKNRKYIDEVCYLYNIDSVSINDRDWAEMKQISTINMVRARGFIK